MIVQSARERRTLLMHYSLTAGLGWMLSQLLIEVLFGPHIGLARTVTLGSGIGAFVGFTISIVQWLTLRSYLPGAGRWIPATTLGCTAGGVAGGFFFYLTVRHLGPFDITLPSGGLIESLVAGFILANCQRFVLRGWVTNASAWVLPVALGMGLAVLMGWLVGVGTLGLLNWLFGLGMWPLIITIAYLVGGVAGGGTFALCSAWALHRVLPQPLQAWELTPNPQLTTSPNPG